MLGHVTEPRARTALNMIEHLSSSSESTLSDTERSSGSDDCSSSGAQDDTHTHTSPSQQYGNRTSVSNSTKRAQGFNQLMDTLRNYLQLSETGSDSDD